MVVGSGYGGSIAASRMARAGQKVCLLERGKEFQPGEYPDEPAEALKEVQTDKPAFRLGSRTGLYDLRLNDDIHVLLGCGLGGTSLINANVMLRAEDRVFDENWPEGLRADLGANGRLERCYQRAKNMLKPNPYPAGQPDYPMPRKTSALQVSAKSMGEGGKFKLTPIAVNFEDLKTNGRDGRNHVGVEQQQCVNCGDCCSGCNYGAKNTVLMNYLPDAWNHGAEIYTRMSVRWIERNEKTGKWMVFVQPMELGRERFSSPPMFVTADTVFLGAGSLGSTEILIRSAQKGLALSGQLGAGFTSNGDVLGFGYNCDQPINTLGRGDKDPDVEFPVGPCITSVIDMRERPKLDDGIVIEEGSMPGALDSIFFDKQFAAAAALFGKDTDRGFMDGLRESWRMIKSFFLGSRTGAMLHTQTMLVMAHDDGNGEMKLRDDRLRIDWPGVGQKPIFEKIGKELYRATKALGGTFLKNPISTALFGHGLITPHPLGGCRMGRDAAQGVVDHKGQVFKGGSGEMLHQGLYVADGAVIPRPLGVNPLWTISALAERMCEIVADERGFKIDYSDNKPTQPPGQIPKIGFTFTETMIGHVSLENDAAVSGEELEGYREAERAAKAKEAAAPGSQRFQFILTIDCNNLDRFVEDPNHEAAMVGTVTAPMLSARPLMAVGGRFNLFAPDPDRVTTKEMKYSMGMLSVEAEEYYFEGFKRIHDDPGLDVWPDTTTLYVKIYKGRDENGELIGRGVLYIGVWDFVKQLRSLRISGTTEGSKKRAAIAKIGKFFAGSLFDSFGKSLSEPILFDPDAPDRPRRPLRIGPAEIYSFDAEDKVQLRMTRYKGGDKGPVLLTHGLGVSSRIFTIDTIETNLTEFLCERGYDVWLLDYRVSIELNSADEPYTGDDVAKYDYPAAVKLIREKTGAEEIQVVAHCFGATTFTLSVLNGLEGVRSAVISQICTDVIAHPLTRIKAGLYLPEFLEKLGVESMTAYVDANRSWFDKLYDASLAFYPIEAEERANNSVHRRITFLYGTLYELDQLNDATFRALHEMFGVANIKALDHLAAMARAKKVVDADGGDTYLTDEKLKNFAFPLLIIQGEENACFMTESTERTVDRLTAINGREYYERKLIPDYGHIDCIFGKNAHHDVFPHIVGHLNAH